MICKHCGFENEGNFDFCPNCGASLTDDVQEQSYSMEESYGDYGNYDNYDGYSNYADPVPEKYSDGLGIASMVLGIISLVCCNLWGIMPIIGLILGVVAKKNAKEAGTKSNFGLAGIILSIVALVLLLLVGVAYIIYFFAVGGLMIFSEMM